jgi:phospholipid/cholesterol/gamma-HCH transport system permease protein
MVAEAVNKNNAAMACRFIQSFPERLYRRSRGASDGDDFGKYNSTGSIGCGFLILLCLLACGCSSSKHSVQSPIIDDFERSGLNAMALRLPAPAMTSLQQALRNYQSLDDLRGQWRVHWAMARIYLSQGDTVAAAHNITAMEMLAPQIDDALLMACLFAWFPQQVLEEQYAHFFVVVVVRELGPLISGVILIAMSATATTAEIDFLRVFREFEVLNGFGINPVFLFLLPVFFAFLLSLVLMMSYFDCICIVSSYAFILLSDPSVPFLPFVSGIVDEIVFNEEAINLVKAVLGGMLIGVISIYSGARATESYEDFSDAIAKSTTSQLLVFFLLNVMLSLLACSQ